ncbi:nickel-dependent lactate racemase [Sporomusa sp.]|uniref:nickel-dependent lactate racemase n=1 Tax=Sporomusa sp. TaxID=2078658 RepID=UPI002B6D8E09|nr:nickel-dependent lactate racemase [Sporomusa sp.]HWR05964.1 nickel-dependent lactate racemase [Sporomusa sp.]
MALITIPYGKTYIETLIPDDHLQGVLIPKSHHYKAKAGEKDLVRMALDNPVASPRLCELAKGCRRIVIITSDHTRPVPTKIIAPLLLEEIRSSNPEAEITFLVATGFHRETTKAELVNKFGEQMFRNEKIVVHNCWSKETMIKAGRLPSGGELIINKLAMEADLLIAEGFIEPHLFAGFSGGRKSVLPGIVSDVTVLANHCAEFIAHEKAKAGILAGNPMHEDMVYAAKQAKLAFILNVAIDADKKIIRAFAGDSEQAHLAGCKFVEELAKVEGKESDIVITSNGGYPLDQNVYQHVKALSSAAAACKAGGVIIACAACNDGHGSQDLYEWLRGGARRAIDIIMQTDKNATIPDQWATQIMARILLAYTVIFVTDQCDHQLIRDMGFETAFTLEEAMAAAKLKAGPCYQITVIPDGVAVIVK